MHARLRHTSACSQGRAGPPTGCTWCAVPCRAVSGLPVQLALLGLEDGGGGSLTAAPLPGQLVQAHLEGSGAQLLPVSLVGLCGGGSGGRGGRVAGQGCVCIEAQWEEGPMLWRMGTTRKAQVGKMQGPGLPTLSPACPMQRESQWPARTAGRRRKKRHPTPAGGPPVPSLLAAAQPPRPPSCATAADAAYFESRDGGAGKQATPAHTSGAGGGGGSGGRAGRRAGGLPGTDMPDVCVRRNWQSEAGAGAWRARLTATRSPGCPRPPASGPVSPLVTSNWLPVRLRRLWEAPEVSVRVC